MHSLLGFFPLLLVDALVSGLANGLDLGVAQFPSNHPIADPNTKCMQPGCHSSCERCWPNLQTHGTSSRQQSAPSLSPNKTTQKADHQKFIGLRQPNTLPPLSRKQYEEVVSNAVYQGVANDIRNAWLKAHKRDMSGAPTSFEPQTRVENGEEAPLSEVPFFAQVVNFTDNSRCGAVIIAEHFVLTVSHCILDVTNLAPEKFQLRIGSVESYTGQTVRVEKIIPYEEGKFGPHVSFCSTADFALIKSRDPIETARHIPVSRLGPKQDTAGTFYGFGFTGYRNEKGVFPQKMQKAKMLVTDVPYGADDHLFATNGKSLRGDSGGGVIWEEFGVRSVGGLCCGHLDFEDKTSKTVFMDLQYYSSWITDQMSKESRTELV